MKVRHSLRDSIFAGVLLIMSSATIQADEITVTYTGDDIAFGALCLTLECDGGLDIFDIGANYNDWTKADSVMVDLGPGTYSFIFQVNNVGTGGSGNPAGFLGEIGWGDNTSSSSSAWQVTTNFEDPTSWIAATEYGENGGDNIWGNVLGAPIAGISTDAQWLWDQYNFQAEMNSTLFFRTSITVVPEPGTLALLGAGLLGIGFARRRKMA